MPTTPEMKIQAPSVVATLRPSLKLVVNALGILVRTGIGASYATRPSIMVEVVHYRQYEYDNVRVAITHTSPTPMAT